MITTINEWKRLRGQKNENVANSLSGDFGQKPLTPGALPDQDEIEMGMDNIPNADVDKYAQICKIADYAKSFELSKGDTVNVITKVFTDPAKAPDNVSVTFVQEHLPEIIAHVERMDDADFPEMPYDYTQDMVANSNPTECAMFIPDNAKIRQLTEALNECIVKNDFKAVYENGIFFINSVEKLNEKNKGIVFKILNECNAKNIGETLKWQRKLA